MRQCKSRTTNGSAVPSLILTTFCIDMMTKRWNTKKSTNKKNDTRPGAPIDTNKARNWINVDLEKLPQFFFFFFQITSEVFYGNGKGHVNPGEAGSLINVGIFKVQTESFQIPGIEVISRKHLFICVMIHHCLESIVLGG